MYSVKRVVKARFIPRGYIDNGDGATISQDDAGSVISDTGDYPEEEKSEVEYYSEYEEDADENVSEISEQDSVPPDYKNLESILTEEDDFAEIKF